MANTTIYDNPSFLKILITTEEIILEKGCRKTTLRDIIERSGLSKGAIYHYVESKDELFGLILQSKIEKMNEEFHQAVANSLRETASKPFGVVSENFDSRQNKKDAANLIFVYLLSQENEKVTNILNQVYRYSKETGIRWIKMGQENGVIPKEINAEKMAVMFMTFSYGLRVTQFLSAAEEEKIELSDIFKLLTKTLT